MPRKRANLCRGGGVVPETLASDIAPVAAQPGETVATQDQSAAQALQTALGGETYADIEGDTVKLKQAVPKTVTSAGVNFSGKATLDLNGFTLEFPDNRLIVVSGASADLTITDTSASKAGTITGRINGGDMLRACSGATITVAGGTIEGVVNVGAAGDNDEGLGTLNVTGGSIEGYISAFFSSNVSISGGTVDCTGYNFTTMEGVGSGYAGYGFAVYLAKGSKAKVEIGGGDVVGKGIGPAVIAYGGELNVTGGTIEGGLAVLASGGKVTVGDKAELVSNATSGTVGAAGVDYDLPAGSLVVDSSEGITSDVTVTGGAFKGEVAFTENGVESPAVAEGNTFAISGGTFDNPGGLLAGYVAQDTLAVAVGGTAYVGTQADAAVKGLEAGDTLTVLKGNGKGIQVPDGVVVENATGAAITVNGNDVAAGSDVVFGPVRSATVAGADRYGTAVAVAEASYPAGPAGVVVAAGYGNG